MTILDDYSLEFQDWEQYITNHPKKFVGQREYRHFDFPVQLRSIETQEASQLIDILKFPDRLAKHKFLPFIRKDKKSRRLKALPMHEQSPGKRFVVSSKNRPIMYASHVDATIFSFYARMLKNLYESQLRLESKLDEAIIAYRKIKRGDGSNKGKSNIDHANDVHSQILKYPTCEVVCLDIRGFFDTINHKLLKQALCKVLKKTTLPKGFSIVFKRIVNYAYVFLDDILITLKHANLVRGRAKLKPNAPSKGRICFPGNLNRILKSKPDLLHTNKKQYGIPQGSPISDIFANIYLLEFDRQVLGLIGKLSFGFYKRYSDDILLVCPAGHAIALFKEIQILLRDRKLQIASNKTEAFYVDNGLGKIADISDIVSGDNSTKGDKQTIRYLGFEMDSSDIHLRSGTVSNFRRRIVNKRKATITAKRKNGGFVNKQRKSKYKYLRLSVKRTQSRRMERQVRKVIRFGRNN